jgi:hypothetical protein
MKAQRVKGWRRSFVATISQTENECKNLKREHVKLEPNGNKVAVLRVCKYERKF